MTDTAYMIPTDAKIRVTNKTRDKIVSMDHPAKTTRGYQIEGRITVEDELRRTGLSSRNGVFVEAEIEALIDRVNNW